MNESTPEPIVARTAPVEFECTSAENSVGIVVRAEIPAGATLTVTVRGVVEDGLVIAQKDVAWSDPASDVRAPVLPALPTTALRFSRSHIAFAGALAVYLCVVLIDITRYPIYFHTDEAVMSNYAAMLLSNGMRNAQGELLPTYFQMDTSFGLIGASAYLQLLPTFLFGQSVLATRTTAAFVTVLAAVAISLLLRDGLRIKRWWLGPLVLAASPAWFLHSRTAFENMLVASLYAVTLYLYSRYRNGSNRSMLACIVTGALTFYAGGLGQLLIGVTSITLAISDLRYHVHPIRRRFLIAAFFLMLLTALPWLRYQLNHDGVELQQLRNRSSYLLDPSLTPSEKFVHWLGEYAFGLSPMFWFLPNTQEIARHTIPGMGNLLLITAPFALIGLITCFRQFRDSAHRLILAVFFIAPIPASIAAVGTTRMLWAIIPWTLLIAVGIEHTIGFVQRIRPRTGNFLTAITFGGLAAASLMLLARALTDGRTWQTDYTLYGLQFGAQQVFGDTVAPTLDADSTSRFIVSPTWANGTDQFVTFFIPKEHRSRVFMGQPIDWIDRRDQITPNTYFVATREEYDKLVIDPLYADIDVRRIISHPNDAPGFYVLSLTFSADIEARVAAEYAARRTPITSTFNYRGKQATAVHSPFGEGTIDRLFDDDSESLVRGLEANPLLVDVALPNAATASAVTVHTGSMQRFTVTVRCYPTDGAEPIEVTRQFVDLGPDPLVTIDLPRTVEFSRFHIEVHDDNAQDSAQIHVREITLR